MSTMVLPETEELLGSGSRRVPTWRQLHPGEDPRIEAMQFERFGTAQPYEKMQMFVNLYSAAIRLALVGLRERYPRATPDELRWRLAALQLGTELAERVYGVPATGLRPPDG